MIEIINDIKSGEYETVLSKIFWLIVAIVLAIIWFGPFFGIADWGGRSSVGCYEEGPDEWVCERP